MIISSNPSRCIHQFFHDKPRELIVDQRLHPLRINLNLNFQTSRLGRKYMTAILKRRLIEACHVRKSNSIHGDSTWDGGRGVATEATWALGVEPWELRHDCGLSDDCGCGRGRGASTASSYASCLCAACVQRDSSTTDGRHDDRPSSRTEPRRRTRWRWREGWGSRESLSTAPSLIELT